MKAATHTSARRVGNLPADTTSFFGRRRDIAEVKRLLSGSRVATLTGPGGVGKTRLALRTAAEVRRAFQDRVWLVELAELRDPDLLAGTVADQLGLHDQSPRDALDVIAEHCGTEPFLLVLDNCEQLVEECAWFVGALIRRCPELRVLATSRQSLGLLGETVFVVPPFPTPDPEHSGSPSSIAHYECVQLFVERAIAVVPDFRVHADNAAALARICHDLDGIPLAIELTAVRLRSLSLAQICDRLGERYRLLSGGRRGVPTRQRTLRALIDWSHELCTAQERLAWARLSVFSGSFSLEAAEQVAGGKGVPPEDVLDVVDALVDKSILMREEESSGVRYRMLQTTREYGEQNLIAGGEHSVMRRRHRDWFARTADRFESDWLGPHQLERIRALRSVHSDLRVALSFCASEPGEAVTGLKMVTQLIEYWGIRGFHAEARHWIDRLRASAPRTSREYATAVRVSAWYALLQEDTAQVAPLLSEARELNRATGDQVERAYIDLIEGMAALFAGDHAAALRFYGKAEAGFQEVGLRRGQLFTAFVYGLALGMREGRDAALARLEDCIADCARLGDRYWRSYALWAVSQLEIGAGNVARADDAAKEGLGFVWEVENRFALAITLDTLAWTAAARGRHERAAVLFGVSASAWETIGIAPTLYRSYEHSRDHFVALSRAALGADRFAAERDRGRALPTASAVEFALGDQNRPETGDGATSADLTPPTPLTRREREIAGLVTQGLMNKEIAARLVISPRTVEAHVEHILVKLGFTSRTQIATWVAAQRSAAAHDEHSLGDDE